MKPKTVTEAKKDLGFFLNRLNELDCCGTCKHLTFSCLSFKHWCRQIRGIIHNNQLHGRCGVWKAHNNIK